jgi:hypothetical protein
MLLPPFWRGRLSHAPAGIRLLRFRAVLRAAQAVPSYRSLLAVAGFHSPEAIDAITDVDAVLAALKPTLWSQYSSLFLDREPSWRQSPWASETRSALLVTYSEARAGIASIKATPSTAVDLYSDAGVTRATADLFHLSRSLASTPNALTSAQLRPDVAVVVFSGMDAGVLTEEQRDQIWNYYQVPLFEQLVGTDGKVIAAECEVHSGLHISPLAAILECVDEEVLVTSLTDTEHPAVRVLSGLTGHIETSPCECGRVEPRLIGLGRSAPDRAATAVA